MNINTETLSLSFRDKALIGVGIGSIALGIALSILLNHNPALFSSSVPLRDYFWTFPTTAVIGLATIISVFREHLYNTINDFVIELENKRTHSKQKGADEKKSQENEAWIHSILKLADLSSQKEISSPQITSEESPNLSEWFSDITKQTQDKREKTKQELEKKKHLLQTELGRSAPSQNLYQQAIFVSIQLRILKEYIPFTDRDPSQKAVTSALNEILGPILALFKLEVSNDKLSALFSWKLKSINFIPTTIKRRPVMSAGTLSNDSLISSQSLRSSFTQSRSSSIFSSKQTSKSEIPAPSFNTNKEHAKALLFVYNTLTQTIKSSFRTEHSVN